MKKIVQRMRILPLAALLLASPASSVLASTNWNIYPFNVEGEFTNDICAVRLWNSWACDTSWVASWTGNPTNQWDPTLDAAGSPSSGSLKTYFNYSSGGFQQAWNFVHMTPAQGPINAARDFAYMAMDMRIDPSSPVNAGGDYGQFLIASISLNNGSDVWADVSRVNPVVSSVGNWVTYQGVPRSDQTNVVAFFIGLQGNNYDTNTPVILNYDNLRFFTPPQASPTLTIEPAGGGLEFVPAPTPAFQDGPSFAMSAASISAGPPLSWMSYFDSGTAAAAPVTYQLNISKFPDGAHSNFVGHMIIAPYASTPEGWRDHPENDLADVIYLTITNNSNGGATATLLYKTNAPTSGTNWISLATVTSPSPVGAWSLTCSNTAFTLKAPNNSSANASLTDDVVAKFAETSTFIPVHFWIGVQPRNTNNFNQMAVYSSFKVSYPDSVNGLTVVTNETWSDSYTVNWANATDCDGINARPANTAYRVSWNGPASGYTLQQKPSLTTGVFTDTGLPNTTSNSRKVSFVPAPVNGNNFYRLFNPNP